MKAEKSMDAETARQLEALDRWEAFKGQPQVIAAKLPQDKKDLQNRVGLWRCLRWPPPGATRGINRLSASPSSPRTF
jgi:hypothetical protein